MSGGCVVSGDAVQLLVGPGIPGFLILIEICRYARMYGMVMVFRIDR